MPDQTRYADLEALKIFKEEYDIKIDEKLNEKINISQGSENAGKILTIDDSGNIIPGNPEVQKATQDASGNIITDTYETKEDAQAKLDEAKSHTDEQIENHIHSWNDLIEKPFYAESVTEEILSETELPFEENSYFGAFVNMGDTVDFTLIEGESYTVVFDDVEYECVAASASFAGSDGIAVGNFAFAGSSNNTGEPFIIGCTNAGGQVLATSKTDATHKVRIYREYEDIHKLDEKYLPDISAVMLVTLGNEASRARTCLPTFVADKTFEEIYAHISSGQIALLYEPFSINKYFYCDSVSEESIVFKNTFAERSESSFVVTIEFIIHNDNTVEYSEQCVDLSDYETKYDAQAKLDEAKAYVDTEIANLVNSAPETLDTLGELATAFEENAEVVDALNEAIVNKADVGHVHSYNDLTDRTHYEGISTRSITWDGVVGDRDAVVTGNGGLLSVYVSDEILTEEQLLGSTFKMKTPIQPDEQGNIIYEEETSPPIEFIHDVSGESSSLYFGTPYEEGDCYVLVVTEVREIDMFEKTGTYFFFEPYVEDNSVGRFVSELILEENVVKQLDEKFLPDTTKYQADWNVNDITSASYIKNKPFYEESKDLLVCEYVCNEPIDTQFESATQFVGGFGAYGDYENRGWNIGYLPEAEYIFGDEYTVVINGVSYKSTLKKCYTDTNGWYAIGLGISEEDVFDTPKADGNVPFICYLSGIESPVEGVSYKGEMYFYLRQETETFPDTTIKIYHGETKIHHLDPKYIKDMYYTSDPVETTIVAETTFELQNGRGQLIAIQPLEVGQEYVITLDGTTYNFVAKFNEDTGVSYIGNLGLIGRGEDTGEMFFIAPMQSPIDLNFGIVINSDVVEHNLSIICNISEVHKIDEKYLPDSVLAKSDWNATENELGHILNRTHYTEKVLNDYIPETTLTFEFAPDGETRYSCFATGTADFEYPERFVDTFNVEFNNNTYDDLLAREYTESDGAFGDGIGNTGMFGGMGFLQYPFLIGFYNAEEAAELGYNYIVYSKNSLTTATLRVARIETVVHQIDEKFIPETIARSSNSTMLVTVKMANTLAVDESYVADKTFSEIYDHIQNGGNAVVYNADMEMYLNFSAMEENSIIFTLNMITPNSQIINFAIARPDIMQMSCNITSDGIITFNSSALIIPDIECSFLETEDKTIAGAINEVNSKFTDGVNAIILKSPNGTRFNITIGDDGVLKADEITA